MSENKIPLSAKALNPATAEDYDCDYPGCPNRATGYLFMQQQFCSAHRDVYVPQRRKA